MKTKLLSTILLALCLSVCLLLLSCNQDADVTNSGSSSQTTESNEEGGATTDSGKGSNGLRFTLSDDKTYYTVEGIGKCKDTDIYIPSTYEGLPVKSIGKEAFENCTELTSITIPNSVTSIEREAFKNCRNLTSITIPNSVMSIDSDTFYGCTGLTSITIPKTVTAIADRAFSGCTNIENVYISDIGAWCEMGFGWDAATPLYYGASLYLNGELVTDLVIPEGVTKIEKFAFAWCKDLNSVTIPSSVTSIGNGAFTFCQNLTSVVIPQSVSEIGYGVFYRCSNLTIYCEAESKPSAWQGDWNSNVVYNGTIIPVVWGYETEK